MWSHRQIPQSSGLERKGETTGGVSYTAQNKGILSKYLLKEPTLQPTKAAYLRIGSRVREEHKRPPDSPKTCDPKPKAEEYVKPLCPSSKMWSPPTLPRPTKPCSSTCGGSSPATGSSHPAVAWGLLWVLPP